MKEILTARARAGEEPETHVMLSPGVGRYASAPPVGTHLVPGAVVGILRVLRRSYRIVVPPGVAGIVTEVLPSGLAARVEFGEPLLVLSMSLTPVAATGEGTRTGSGGAGTDGIPEGMLAVRSPTDGIFYRRPSPDQPLYVEEGDSVARGTVLGLVEVMKCFNQIAYGPGPEDPDEATVHRILVEDADEVKLGQPLVLLSPSEQFGT